jgi:hypothetical protein
MRYGRSILALLITVAALNGSACAMAATSEPALGQGINCTVQNADKLPPQLGGEAAICSIMANILLPSLHQAGLASSALALFVNVKSESRISAVASVNGKPMPEQNVASSDRSLSAGAIEMLAQGVAREVAKLGS